MADRDLTDIVEGLEEYGKPLVIPVWLSVAGLIVSGALVTKKRYVEEIEEREEGGKLSESGFSREAEADDPVEYAHLVHVLLISGGARIPRHAARVKLEDVSVWGFGAISP